MLRVKYMNMEEKMKNKIIYLLGAAVGAFPYVAALWMLLNGYGY